MSFEIKKHPILDFSKEKKIVKFYFNEQEFYGFENEPIILSLRNNGIMKLKEGTKKHTPFGPFCMQGRCCSCSMNVDNLSNVMTCVTLLKKGMMISNAKKKFSFNSNQNFSFSNNTNDKKKSESYDVVVIGGGPAGLEAALMALRSGVNKLAIFDDKKYLGGQLKLQTHTFFGTEELGASIRGHIMALDLETELRNFDAELFLGKTVVGLYPNNLVSFKGERGLDYVFAKKIICATGASEKFLSFQGNCLPGVMGAGGAQTFMNIYGIKPGKKVLIVGGGNIGVILAYQLVQANVEVVCLIEGRYQMGAYDVHIRKVQSLGIPIYTSHTIKKAHGKDKVEGASIIQVDENWNEYPSTEKFFEVDTVCLAVGLNPLNELLWPIGCQFEFSPELGEVPIFNKFQQTTLKDIFVAGDCAVIGEASIARLEGRIAGLKAAFDLGYVHQDFSYEIDHALDLLDKIQSGTFGKRIGLGKHSIKKTVPKSQFSPKSFKQDLTAKDFVSKEKKLIISCSQDIPCNPCESSCKFNAIVIGNDLNNPPSIIQEKCKGCGLCLSACPGRAIRILQYNYSDHMSAITIPYEFNPFPVTGESYEVCDSLGEVIDQGEVISIKRPTKNNSCGTVSFIVNKENAFKSINLKQTAKVQKNKTIQDKKYESNEVYICRCEEVTYSQLKEFIKKGYDNFNDLKRVLRIGMGQCQGLSCKSLVEDILRKELKKDQKKLFLERLSRSSSYRPPVKKISLKDAANLNFHPEDINLLQATDYIQTIPFNQISAFKREKEKFLEKTQNKKIAVIGGGISGIMTAWWLTELGETDVIVIEKDFLTAGQTGACLGGVRSGFNTFNKVKRAQKGMDIFKKSIELVGEDVGWHQGGYVYVSYTREQDLLFEESIKTWDMACVEYKIIRDKNCFSKYVPGLDISKISSIVYFEDCGGINPFKSVYAFAESFRKRGGTILNNTEVVDIVHNGKKISAIQFLNKSNRKVYEMGVEHVVNAAGTGAAKISGMVGVDITDQIWIERHGALVTEKMPLWLDPLIVSYHPTLSGYWQQKRMEKGATEGEIIACYTPDKIVKGFNKNSYLYFASRMAKSILNVQPRLADIGILRFFSEHYVGRSSGIPIIGKSPLKGFWFNIAKNGHGLMCAPGDGYCLAQSILKGETHDLISECTLDNKEHLRETMK